VAASRTKATARRKVTEEGGSEKRKDESGTKRENPFADGLAAGETARNQRGRSRPRRKNTIAVKEKTSRKTGRTFKIREATLRARDGPEKKRSTFRSHKLPEGEGYRPHLRRGPKLPGGKSESPRGSGRQERQGKYFPLASIEARRLFAPLTKRTSGS